jgi:hypothetical protein
MKELIKPNTIEEQYSELSSYDEGCSRYCSDGRRICDKYCTGGASNSSPVDDSDILF